MKSGFTLIELVIGLLISSIIMMALYSSFYITSRVIKSTDTIISVDVHVAIIEHQFENDLSGAFVPVQLEGKSTDTVIEPGKQAVAPEKEIEQKDIKDIFISTNKENALQSLSFITCNPLQIYHKEGSQQRMVRVVYKVIPNETKTAFTLLRQESPNLDLKAFDVKGPQAIRAYELAANIKSIKTEYYYPQQQEETKEKKEEQKTITFKMMNEWGKETSQAKEKESIPKIPEFITITIELWDLAQERAQTFVFNYTIAAFNASLQPPEKEKSKKREAQKQQPSTPITKP